MIIGVGTDIVRVARIKKLLKNQKQNLLIGYSLLKREIKFQV